MAFPAIKNVANFPLMKKIFNTYFYGMTSDATDLNKCDGVTAGTVTASKFVQAGASSDISGLKVNDLVVGATSHSYGSAATAWTLSAAELLATRIIVTLASDAVDAIAPATLGKILVVVNTSGQALTVKASGQTGIVIASTKTAILMGNGTDWLRVTADV